MKSSIRFVDASVRWPLADDLRPAILTLGFCGRPLVNGVDRVDRVDGVDGVDSEALGRSAEGLPLNFEN